MEDWALGYNVEFTYVPYFLRELSPQCINLALIKSGYLPPSNETKTYCELGCGLGYTSLILAACYPDYTFYAVDFNSEHIARAQEFARKAKLDNVHFFDLSFAEFATQDLPKFDYIIAHGVWTWVAESSRQDIIKFVNDRLNTNGAFYISYNAMPGSAPYQPLQKIYYHLYKTLPGTPKERIAKTIEFVDRMIEKKMSYFEQFPQAKARHDSVKAKSSHYFAHEFLNANWDCYYVSEVSDALQNARVKYVGSASLSENATSAAFEKDCKDILSFISDNISQEQLKDYAQAKMFRKDLFMRGAIQLPALEMIERINELRFCVFSDPSSLSHEISVDGQNIKLPKDGHQAIIEALSTKPRTFAELQQLPILSKFPYSNLFQLVGCIFEVNQIAILRDENEIIDRSPAERLNKVILEHTKYNVGYNYFAMPEFGYGIECNQIEQIFLKAIKEKADPIQAAMDFLRITNETLRKDGKPITDPKEKQKVLKEAELKFRSERLPYYEKIAIAA
ncbi:MAG: class I SAM-dependent methyltransferase [Pseudomonadota bacterium]